MEYLSIKFDTSIVPFFGIYGWFLGPPSRNVPITMCLGNPIVCPQIDEPTQQDIDTYHSMMLQSYTELFEQHKTAYGWNHKHIKFV